MKFEIINDNSKTVSTRDLVLGQYAEIVSHSLRDMVVFCTYVNKMRAIISLETANPIFQDYECRILEPVKFQFRDPNLGDSGTA